MKEIMVRNDIFKELKLKNIVIKNRIVRSATNDHLGNTDGTISEKELSLFEELAKNHVGLIISGHACVSSEGRVDETQNYIYEDSFIHSFQKIPERIKKYSSKIIIQINHGGKEANPDCNGGKISVGPSSDDNTRELSIAEIKNVERDFINAAYRLKQSGVDGVQVHIAHGYLLCQFLSVAVNRRTDEYGGGIENRFRMANEIIKGIKERCGDDFPVFAKINCNSEIGDEQYEKDLIYIASECKKLGVEAIEFSGYNFYLIDKVDNEIFYLNRIAKLKKLVDIPMILVGGINSFDEMKTVLNSGIESIAISSGFICEPDLISRLINGQKKAKCIYCNQCFSIFETKKKRCVFHDDDSM